ncbi:MAG TPA: signal peptidase I [Pseudolabrys sp.]|jgi:signal peptidase I|nr:signal peptidase I [Pseudolabrys sp.]
MDFDFALLLVVLTAVTGVVALLDQLFLRPRRKARAIALAGAEGSDAERQQRAQEAMREPIVVEYARSFFPVILIVLLFRSFLAEPFKIPSGSMMPTLLVGDFILVNKFAYGLRLPVLGTKIVDIGEPKRGDVFVFRYPNPEHDPRKEGLDYIKRVIGLPGDEITYRNKTLYVNGKEVPQADVGPFAGSGSEGRRMAGAEIHEEMLPEAQHQILQSAMLLPGREGSWRVPAGHYFAMGDNRDNSEDSRYWGFVPEQNVIGKAFVIWMNWDSGIDFKRIGSLIN